MALIMLRSTCDSGRTCPNVNASDRGMLIVQGYTVLSPDICAAGLLPGEADEVVEVPGSLLPGLASQTGPPNVVATARETYLIQGKRLTDPHDLAELNLPDGESAIEIQPSALPAWEGVGNA